MKSIHDLEGSFSYKYKSSMFASRDVCILFGKETWSHMRCRFEFSLTE